MREILDWTDSITFSEELELCLLQGFQYYAYNFHCSLVLKGILLTSASTHELEEILMVLSDLPHNIPKDDQKLIHPIKTHTRKPVSLFHSFLSY